jgi:hypothetical protein
VRAVPDNPGAALSHEEKETPMSEPNYTNPDLTAQAREAMAAGEAVYRDYVAQGDHREAPDVSTHPLVPDVGTTGARPAFDPADAGNRLAS